MNFIHSIFNFKGTVVESHNSSFRMPLCTKAQEDARMTLITSANWSIILSSSSSKQMEVGQNMYLSSRILPNSSLLENMVHTLQISLPHCHTLTFLPFRVHVRHQYIAPHFPHTTLQVKGCTSVYFPSVRNSCVSRKSRLRSSSNCTYSHSSLLMIGGWLSFA